MISPPEHASIAIKSPLPQMILSSPSTLHSSNTNESGTPIESRKRSRDSIELAALKQGARGG
jgi:hypothetical protein